MSYQTYQNKSVRINYLIKGEGKPLIFLHGIPVFSINWHYQIEYFSQFYQVIVPDFRGVGDSSKPKGFYNYRVSAISTDIIQLIEHLDLKKVVLIGHDYGGFVANYIAMNRGDLVDKLALISFPYPASFLGAFKNRKQFAMSFYAFLAQIPILPEWFVIKYREEIFKSIPNVPNQNVDQYLDKIQTISDAAKIINCYRTIFWYLFPFFWKRPIIEQETLLIFGEKDPIMGNNLFQDSRQYFINYNFKPLPNVAHWPHNQVPKIVNQILNDFIQKK
jgi:pimeloyl-ACP methyl ester carboxylesterase